MNIEQTLKELIVAEGYEYVHLVDGYALNTMLPQLTMQEKPFVVNYISLGSTFKIVNGIRYESSRIQLLMADIVQLSSDAQEEANSISSINETQKEHIANIIDALNADGRFEQISEYSCVEIPFRFDAICACTTCDFTITDALGECLE